MVGAMAGQVFTSHFTIDSGHPERDAELSPEQRRTSTHGILSFDLPDAAGPDSPLETVDFGELLFWIEPELNRRRELARLSLLMTSDFIGFGELIGTLRRLPSSNASECRWRVEIDPASVTAPPVAPGDVHSPDHEPIPDTAVWPGGAAVQVTRAEDSSVRRIDLTILTR